MSPLRALLVVLCLTPCLAMNTFLGNATFCGDAGCDWDTPDLWSAGYVPNATDAGVMVNAPGALIKISKAAVVVMSLTVMGAKTQLVAAQDIMTVMINVTQGAELSTSASIVYSVPPNMTAGDNKIFNLDVASTLSFTAATSAMKWSESAEIYGAVTMATGSSFMANFVQLGNSTWTIAPAFVNVTVVPTATAVFNAGLTANYVVVSKNANANIAGAYTGGLTVNGVATFSGSPIVIVNPNAAVNGTAPTLGSGWITFNGAAAASTASINLGSQAGFSGSVVLDGTLAFTVANLAINQLWTADKAVVDLTGNGLSFGVPMVNGTMYPLTLRSLTADGLGVNIINGSVSATTVTLNGELDIQSASVLAAGTFTVAHGANLTLGGHLMLTGASMLVIPANASMVALGSTQLTGSLMVEGTLTLGSDHTLTIHNGGYTQSGTLMVTMESTNAPALNVTDSTITIMDNSTVLVSLNAPQLKSANYVMAVAKPVNTTTNETHTVIGMFPQQVQYIPGAKVYTDVSFQYTADSIYIQYNWNIKDVPIWMWVVLGVAVAVILIAFIAIIVKCRRRSGYEPVH